MIEGYLPGLVRVDPVGVAPAEVVRLAARCELLEAVAEAARAYRENEKRPATLNGFARDLILVSALDAALAALVAAGAAGKAGT